MSLPHSGRISAITCGTDVVDVLRVNEEDGWVYFIASPETPLERYRSASQTAVVA